MKKVIYSILLMIWLYVIFVLSNQSGTISGNNSSELIKYSLTTFYYILNISTENIDSVITLIHNPLRELMHTFEYFILCFLTFKNIQNFNIKYNKYVTTLLFCFICSILDEVHQSFIPGRTLEYFDILMDMMGSFLMLLFIKIHNKSKVL